MNKSLKIILRAITISIFCSNLWALNDGDGLQANQMSDAYSWDKQTRFTLERMAENLERTLKPWPVPDRTFKVEEYGAVSDGETVNTIAIQKAIDDCSANGGGVVLFSQGDYVTGTIDLKSGVMLEISKDSRFSAAPTSRLSRSGGQTQDRYGYSYGYPALIDFRRGSGTCRPQARAPLTLGVQRKLSGQRNDRQAARTSFGIDLLTQVRFVKTSNLQTLPAGCRTI